MDALDKAIAKVTKQRDELSQLLTSLQRASAMNLMEPVKRRKRKNAWTPERRKAQGDRVRARHKANGADGEPTTAA